jgi:hypothetical protein
MKRVALAVLLVTLLLVMPAAADITFNLYSSSCTQNPGGISGEALLTGEWRDGGCPIIDYSALWTTNALCVNTEEVYEYVDVQGCECEWDEILNTPRYEGAGCTTPATPGPVSRINYKCV